MRARRPAYRSKRNARDWPCARPKLPTMSDPLTPADDELVVPLWAERAAVETREVVTGRVRVSTHVEEHDETVRAELARDQVEVTRVPVGVAFDEPPKTRREGTTLIIPVVEEMLVIVKRYLLKEEVHITATSTVETVEEVVRLRSLHADVQRSPPGTDPQT